MIFLKRKTTKGLSGWYMHSGPLVLYRLLHIQADEIHPDFYDLLIEWESAWFTQDADERLLEEC